MQKLNICFNQEEFMPLVKNKEVCLDGSDDSNVSMLDN